MTPKELVEQFGPRESMAYDVVIVGAGPAGLATAIGSRSSTRIFQSSYWKGIGARRPYLSCAVMDPKALTELFPDWKERARRSTSP